MTIAPMRHSSAAPLIAMLALASGQAEAAAKPAGPSTSSPIQILPGTASKEPVSIDADKLVYYDKEQKAVYSGNVVVIQGDTKMTCSVMTVLSRPLAHARSESVGCEAADEAEGGPSASSGIKHLEATGPVTVDFQDPGRDWRQRQLRQMLENKVQLIGHVTLSDGQNVTTGDKLTYDLKTGQATIDTAGSKSGPGSRAIPAECGRRRSQGQIGAWFAQTAGAVHSIRSELQPVSDDLVREKVDAPGRRKWFGARRSGASANSKSPWDGANRQGVLAVHNLGKGYRGRMVVQDVSISVRRGEAVGLLGPNGAGKTTVFYMIMGLVKPDKGAIELDGHEVTGLPMFQRARLGVGYLPQEASIFRGLNVEDNIRAVLEVDRAESRRARGDARISARRVRHRSGAQGAFDFALRRRATTLRDRAGARG